MSLLRSAAALTIAAALLGGCGSGNTEEDKVRDTAVAFAQAIADGNAKGACALADVKPARCVQVIKAFNPAIAKRSIDALKKAKVKIKDGESATIEYQDGSDKRTGGAFKRNGKWLIFAG